MLDGEEQWEDGAAPVVAMPAIDPCATSLQIVAAFREDADAPIDPAEGHAALRAQVEAVRGGAYDSAEATLVGQAAALNAIFAHMARRGHAHLDRPGKAGERYLRLALRAQAQCRATLNALTHVAGQRPEEREVTPTYTLIEREIVYPPQYPGDAERRVPYGSPGQAGAA